MHNYLGKLVEITFCFGNYESLTLSGNTIKRLEFGNIKKHMVLSYDGQKQMLVQFKNYETNYLALDIDKEKAIEYLINEGEAEAAYTLKRLQRYLDIIDIIVTYENYDGHKQSMDIYVPYISKNGDDNVLETVKFDSASAQYERNKEAIRFLNIILDCKQSDFVDLLSIEIGNKQEEKD